MTEQRELEAALGRRRAAFLEALAALEADVARCEGRHELAKRGEMAATAGALVARAQQAATEANEINVQARRSSPTRSQTASVNEMRRWAWHKVSCLQRPWLPPFGGCAMSCPLCHHLKH